MLSFKMGAFSRGSRDNRRDAGEKRVPVLSRARVEAAALRYLERFGGTESKLRRVLQRRVAKSVEAHDTDPEEAELWVDAAVGRMKELGYLDDGRFARDRMEALRRRGKSARAMTATLRHQGVASELVSATVRVSREEEAAAALVAVRRKGWKPLSGDRATRQGMQAKRLASLARQGFSFSVAKQALASLDADVVEDLSCGSWNESSGSWDEAAED